MHWCHVQRGLFYRGYARDAIMGALNVIGNMEKDDGLTQIVLDFSDAFKMLPVVANEKRFLAGSMAVHGTQGLFFYTTLLFGIISGPLLCVVCIARACAGVCACGHVVSWASRTVTVPSRCPHSH